MQDVSDAFRGSGFKIFANMLAGDPTAEVWAIPAPKRRQPRFLRPDEFLGAGRGPARPRLYLLARRRGGRRRSARQEYRAGAHQADRRPARPRRRRCLFFVAGKPKDFVKFAGPARTKVGEELGLIAKDRFDLCWIVDFPMYEWNEEEKKIDFSHNPFSMPNMAVEEFLALDPNDNEKLLGMKAIQYDIVCNGIELSSGAIRNHRPDVMKKAFAIAGYGEDVLEQKFGGMLRALSLRRAAARRHRARHRPHRHAAGRRGEPARGRAVPDEPARRGPADGRAVGSHAEAAQRTAYPARSAEEVKPPGRFHRGESTMRRCASSAVAASPSPCLCGRRRSPRPQNLRRAPALQSGAESVYSLDKVLEVFRRNGITGIVATSRPNKGTHQLVEAKARGLWVVPFIRPYRVRNDIQTWFNDPATLDLLEEEYKRGYYRGIGEFHLYGKSAATRDVKKTVDFAVAHDLYLHAIAMRRRC